MLCKAAKQDMDMQQPILAPKLLHLLMQAYRTVGIGNEVNATAGTNVVTLTTKQKEAPKQATRAALSKIPHRDLPPDAPRIRLPLIIIKFVQALQYKEHMQRTKMKVSTA